MKKILTFLILCAAPCVFAIDSKWCLANGGVVNLQITNSCMIFDINSTTFVNKIYDIVCIPYLSSILNNRKTLFLKLISNQENPIQTYLDEYNWKISKEELIKYI